jgi:integrase
MPRPRDPGVKFWGPSEESDGRWRVTVRDRAGERRAHTFKTKRGADKFVERLRDEESERPDTVAKARELYLEHLVGKGGKSRSRTTTGIRLSRFLAPLDHLDPASVTKKIVRDAYDDYILHGRVTQKEIAARAKGLEIEVVDRKPLAADTHRNTLIEARSFFRWMVEKEWIAENPIEEVKGKGKRRHGKVQMRLDEARRFYVVARTRALDTRQVGSDGAAAALIALLMGLRATEITLLRVRDVDDRGTLLWVEDDGAGTLKTDAARRKLDIPRALRDVFEVRTRGHAGDAFLFPTELKGEDGRVVIGPHYRDWPREQIAKLCSVAGVPRITAHGARNVAPTVAADRGVLGRVVAEAMGHEEYSTTEQSYLRRGAADEARRRKGVSSLTDEDEHAPE